MPRITNPASQSALALRQTSCRAGMLGCLTSEPVGHHLTTELDLRPATVRNYLSNVQQFMAWC